MQLCIGTSMAIIVPTAVRSYWAHRAKGLVIPGVLRSWSLPAVVGVAVGSIAAAIAPPGVFELAFVVIAGIIAAKFLAGREDWVFAHHLPSEPAMTVWGFLIGLASSLMGSDHNSRHSRLCAGGLAASGRATAAFGRFRFGDRRRPDRTDLELYRAVRGAPRARSAPALARDRVRLVPAGCVGALCREPSHADALTASLRPLAAIPWGSPAPAGRRRACAGGLARPG